MNEIRILSPSLLRPLSEEIPSEEVFRLFREGETLGGRVVRQIDDRRAFLHVRGKDLLVESQAPLPPGVELRFRVEEVQPRVTLKLLPPETPEGEMLSSLLKRLLSGDVALGALAENLEGLGKGELQAAPPALQESCKKFFHLLQRFSSQALFSADPRVLRALIEDSGFFWENKIRQWALGEKNDPRTQLIQGDLKGLGSRVLEDLEGLSQAGGGRAETLLKGEELKEGLAPFIRKIELYQILNLLPVEGEERFSLFLPFWVGSQLQFLELNLSLPQKGPAREEREDCSVLFLLNLPALGRVRIEIRMKEKDLFCRFRFSESRVSDFVRQALPGLGGKLGELGYEAHLEVLLDTAERPNESLLGEMETGSHRLVNRVV